MPGRGAHGGTPGLEEIRAGAAREGLAPADADLETVRDFLAVFLPAVEGLADLLPPRGAGAGPSPLGADPPGAAPPSPSPQGPA